MTDFYAYIRPVLMALPPETAHCLTLAALKAGLGSVFSKYPPSLQTTVFGKSFSNPLGLAAGFDKDAEALTPLFRMGFGFVEAGTVTPRPQAGNPPPRLFRDVRNESVINRLGFPGRGLAVFKKNVRAFRAKNPSRLLGINIGMNKETASPLDDYKTCLQALSPLADYVAVNISSPNTAGLRDLQAREALESLLSGLMPFKTCPILLKVAPDLSQAQCADVAALAMAYKMDGLIVSNTTIARPAQLATTLQQEKGGLSGRLLCDISTQKISEFYHLTEGRLPIIGVGGIASAEDAYAKIRAGASLVELYTGLVYQGPALIARILEGLVALLEKDGFSSISEAVGTSQNRLKAVG